MTTVLNPDTMSWTWSQSFTSSSHPTELTSSRSGHEYQISECEDCRLTNETVSRHQYCQYEQYARRMDICDFPFFLDFDDSSHTFTAIQSPVISVTGMKTMQASLRNCRWSQPPRHVVSKNCTTFRFVFRNVTKDFWTLKLLSLCNVHNHITGFNPFGFREAFTSQSGIRCITSHSHRV